MRVIYKYAVKPMQRTVIDAAVVSPLYFGLDGKGELCVWLVVDDPGNEAAVEIAVLGTGHDLAGLGKMAVYIGSAIVAPFVWHAFMERRLKPAHTAPAVDKPR